MQTCLATKGRAHRSYSEHRRREKSMVRQLDWQLPNWLTGCNFWIEAAIEVVQVGIWAFAVQRCPGVCRTRASPESSGTAVVSMGRLILRFDSPSRFVVLMKQTLSGSEDDRQRRSAGNSSSSFTRRIWPTFTSRQDTSSTAPATPAKCKAQQNTHQHYHINLFEEWKYTSTFGTVVTCHGLLLEFAAGVKMCMPMMMTPDL